ncbi:MFS transporter [Rhodococcus sp. P1Y]|uniref:MFS transporter n=1 Tax=Rhodococcus sp. P1Y TaxID=1302308 RepID=UPI000EB228EB|nr:MFS transporter [Rhodococcus sp. P1Y]AYJ48278.1 MFS transporter [Rhodococcus sp. P1Y]
MKVDSPRAHRTADDDAGWTLPGVLSLASIVIVLEALTLSYAMMAIALPAMSIHYGTTQGAWVFAAFLLVGAVASPVVGKLADTHGKRRLLMLCVGFGIVGSVVSAVAPTFTVLVVGRAISGLLVASLFLSYSLIRDVFPPRTVALAVSIATTGMGLIAIPTPFLAGWLLDGFGFRSIFWFLAAVLAVGAVLILLTTPESAVRLRSTIDPIGAVLLGSGLGGVLVAVSFGSTWGWTATSTLFFLLGGIAALAAWVVSSRIIKDPLVDLRLFAHRPVLLISIAAGFVYGISALISIMLPLMIMTPDLGLGYGFGASAEQFAFYGAPMGALAVVGGLAVGLVVGRKLVKPRTMIILGLATSVVGASAMAFSHDGKLLVVVLIGVFGLGQGIAYATIPNLQIEAVPPQLQASTASIVAVFQSTFAASLPVIMYAVLNANVAFASEGAVVYSDNGIKYAFLFAGACALVGVLASILMPRRVKRLAVPSEQTDIVAAEPSSRSSVS